MPLLDSEEALKPGDTVDDGCMFYPIFCVADVPPKWIDELIDSSMDHYRSQTFSGAAWYVATSTDKSGVTHATRTPTAEFVSPFLNMDFPQLYRIFWEHFRGGRNWTRYSFAVLDWRSIEDKTVILCSDESGRPETVRVEFELALSQIVPFEMRTTSVFQASYTFADPATDGVITARYRREHVRDAIGMVDEFKAEDGTVMQERMRRKDGKEDGEWMLTQLVRVKDEVKWFQRGKDGGKYDDPVKYEKDVLRGYGVEVPEQE